MRILRRYFRLTAFERWIVIRCIAGLVITRVGLRVMGFGAWRKVVAALAPLNLVDGGGEGILSFSGGIARMQAAAERHLFFRPSCLEHALVLWGLLRRYGVAADLRIGGRKENGRFEAHAWVEIAGVPLDDEDGAHRNFAPFAGPVAVMESQTR